MASTVFGNIVGGGTVAAQVGAITGNAADAAAAAGYGAWVESITGSYPKVLKQQGQAVVVLTDAQAAQMRQWLDRQLVSTVLPGPREPKSLNIQFGPVAGPIAMKYLVIVGAAFFLLGFAGRGWLR